MRGKPFLLFFLFCILIIPISANAYTGTLLDRDGGIGNSTHYLEESPNISLDPKIKEIIDPVFAKPAIKEAGETLVIKVDTGGELPGGWKASLTNIENSPLKNTYDLPVNQTKEGTSYWKDSSSIYEIVVSIPKDIPEQLYDLNISYTSNGKRITDKQPHAVKVIKKYKKNFTFMHLTDLHVGSPRNLNNPENTVEAGFWNPDKSKRWLYLQKAMREVNLLQPDFVVVTGDLMFGQMNPQEYIYEYEETYRMLKKFNVPIYLVPGNHDYYAQDATLADGAKYWEKYFGPQYFSFDYGPYAHMIGYNSFDWHKFDRSGHGTVSVPTWGGQVRQQQMEWIKKDLIQNEKTKIPSQVTGLFSHHNPLWRDRDIWPEADSNVQQYWKEYDLQHNPQRLDTLLLGEKLGTQYDQQWHGEGAHELIDLMEQHGVDISLHGHTHIDNISKQNGILYSTTAAIELTGKPWVGFRLFEKDQQGFNSYIYEEPHNSMPVYQDGNTSTGVMSLESYYEKPNDGTAASQKATVYNRYNKAITVTLPFYMKPGDYKTSSGSIVNELDNSDMHYLEVKVTIPANSTSSIEVN
ncbi:metallophosphoesterase family protein [Pseudalkalibacillus caeni]|uniref:Calcineurin-like phosphoesterase domain-containing protein n=1 Tax=Exobacillus caeni TaxID=2574798 RepID=A0A5R9F9E9_9BACL|nr:metallophosphoesterase [Pseudalkalibacillus caeni]TLS37174.1 hypothetical protein FCL54_11650 [Pseudalkalibacillus caeni]